MLLFIFVLFVLVQVILDSLFLVLRLVAFTGVISMLGVHMI